MLNDIAVYGTGRLRNEIMGGLKIYVCCIVVVKGIACLEAMGVLRQQVGIAR